jgi:excisionase family DNA binding protein
MAVIQSAQTLGNLVRTLQSASGAEHLWRMLTTSVREQVPEDRREFLLEHLAVALGTDVSLRPQAKKKYLTPTEVAEDLGVTPPTVRAWLASGALRAERTGQLGKRVYYRIRREDLDLFLRSGGSRRSGTPADPATEASRLLAKINGWTDGRRK